jgi:hypothetical protein
MPADLDELLARTAIEPTGPVDVDAVLARGARRRRNRRAVRGGSAAAVLVALAVSAAVVADGSSEGEVTTDVPTTLATEPAPPTTAPSTSTTVPAPTTTTALDPDALPVVDRDITLLAPAAVPDAPWTLAVDLPYGDGEDELGLHVGGDAGGVARWGPEAMAIDGQGRWWVVDGPKGRVARFAPDGTFLDAVPLAGLGPGAAQFASVVATDDGEAFVAYGTGGAGFAVLPDDTVVPLELGGSQVAWSDGDAVYPSYLGGEVASQLTFRIVDGTATPSVVPWPLTPRGDRYWVHREPDPATMFVDLPDAPTPMRLALHVRLPGGEASPSFAGAQHVVDADGRIHLLIAGCGAAVQDGGAPVQCSTYIAIEPDGTVSAVEAVPYLDGETSPGSLGSLRLDRSRDAPVVFEHHAAGVRAWRRDPR